MFSNRNRIHNCLIHSQLPRYDGLKDFYKSFKLFKLIANIVNSFKSWVLQNQKLSNKCNNITIRVHSVVCQTNDNYEVDRPS